MVKKIVLLCSAGMSTNILVNKMRFSAKEQGFECTINAYSVSEADTCVGDADVVLLGPQVRFHLDQLKKQYPAKKIEVMAMRDYGLMDGEGLLLRAKEIIES